MTCPWGLWGWLLFNWLPFKPSNQIGVVWLIYWFSDSGPLISSTSATSLQTLSPTRDLLNHDLRGGAPQSILTSPAGNSYTCSYLKIFEIIEVFFFKDKIFFKKYSASYCLTIDFFFFHLVTFIKCLLYVSCLCRSFWGHWEYKRKGQ